MMTESVNCEQRAGVLNRARAQSKHQYLIHALIQQRLELKSRDALRIEITYLPD
ncbi:MAG: hypothetical protein AAF827_04755 [Cyanobacteria bacterium P01_D01_bin.6]